MTVTGNGIAAPAALSLSPSSIDYGTVEVGSTLNRTFTITNTGGETATGRVDTIAGSPQFSCVGGCGSFSLSGGASKVVTYQFAPDSASIFSGRALMRFDQGSNPSVDLAGVGNTSSYAEIAAGSSGWGLVISPSDYFAADVRNVGTEVVTYSTSLPGGTGIHQCMSNCSGTLNPGETRRIHVSDMIPGDGLSSCWGGTDVEFRITSSHLTVSPWAGYRPRVSIPNPCGGGGGGGNAAPTADAGSSRTITLPTSSTTAFGAGGSDSDGSIDSITWSQQSGPGLATITGDRGYTPTFSGLIEGTYTFRITVTDDDGATDTDDMTVTVNPVPVANDATNCVMSGVPGVLNTGQTFTATMQLTNSGGTTWTSAGSYGLGSQSPAGNVNWGTDTVSLPSSVNPGADGIFTYTFTAPAVAGIYDFDWQMFEGASDFGVTCSQPIDVQAAPVGNDLQINRVGDGASVGSLTVSPSGASCGADCHIYATPPVSTSVMLTGSIPNGIVTFSGYVPCDSSTSNCAVTVDSDRTIDVHYDCDTPTYVWNGVGACVQANSDLTVTKSGDASDITVASDVGNINCGTGSDCTDTYPYTTTVTLSPTSVADGTIVYTGGGPSCDGGNTCVVDMDADVTINADINCTAPAVYSAGACVTPTPDVAISGINATPGTTYSTSTGEFTGHEVRMVLTNTTAVDVPNGTVVPYEIRDSGATLVGSANVTTGTIVQSGTENHDLPVSAGFGPGSHPLTVTIAPPGSVDQNPGNNSGVTSLSLALADPDTMNVNFGLDVIRSGDNAEVIVAVESTVFTVECVLTGPLLQDPGGLYSYSPSDTIGNIVAGPGTPFNDSFTAGPLANASEYTLTCTEPVTATVFDPVSRIIDVVPVIQET